MGEKEFMKIDAEDDVLNCAVTASSGEPSCHLNCRRCHLHPEA
jgi:hypothetical protein